MATSQQRTRAEGRKGARFAGLPTTIVQDIRDALDPAKAPGPVKTWSQMSGAERAEIEKSLKR